MRVVITDETEHYDVDDRGCPDCFEQSPRYKKQVFKNKSVHIRTECSRCGKFLCWAKQVNPEPWWQTVPPQKVDETRAQLGLNFDED